MATATFEDPEVLQTMLDSKYEELERAENALIDSMEHKHVMFQAYKQIEAMEAKEVMLKAYKQHCSFVEACASAVFSIQTQVNNFMDTSWEMSSSRVHEVHESTIPSITPKNRVQTTSTSCPQAPARPPPANLLKKRDITAHNPSVDAPGQLWHKRRRYEQA